MPFSVERLLPFFMASTIFSLSSIIWIIGFFDCLILELLVFLSTCSIIFGLMLIQIYKKMINWFAP